MAQTSAPPGPPHLASYSSDQTAVTQDADENGHLNASQVPVSHPMRNRDAGIVLTEPFTHY
jgi:hypothetical protein